MSLRTTVRHSLTTSIALAGERIRRSPRRVFVTWLLQAVVLFVIGSLLPGILVEDLAAALIAAAVIAALNALVRPIIVVLTLPLTVATFGLLSLLINSSMIVLAAPLVPGLEVNGFLPAFSLAVILTVATTLVNVLLAVDEDETFYAELARRIEVGEGPTDGPRPAGLVVIQIDGLAAPILRNAIRVGTVPRMASWVRSGDYVLSEWECPPPSQTSASQAGILHGNNDDIPAFRWFEKESGRLLVSNHPADAREIERRVSDGNGLLHPAGTSVGNLFSGDAAQSAFVMSRIGDTVGSLDIDAFSLYFVDPAAFIRTVVLSTGEFIKELFESYRQRVQDIEPRVHRGVTFAFLRAATNVVLRDLNTTFVVRSMSLGVPIVYADLTDYDEIAHHAGPERYESLRALSGIDRVVRSLERAATDAPRDYRFVLLSDHGQSQGATFEQRYGQSLEAFVHDLMGGDPDVVAATGRSETFGPVNALLSELSRRPGVTGRATRAVFDSRSLDGSVDLGAEEQVELVSAATDVVVCASGNLANIYFTSTPQRMTVADIDQSYPGLLAGIAQHEGIGFAMVRSAQGTVVIGAAGVHFLDDDRVDGVDPLAPFGKHAADHLRRLDGFGNIGDILVNSSYDEDLEEVAAFEELVGSHGGMGGPQTRPFLLHPAELAVADEPLVGAPAVYHQLRAWAASLAVEGAALRRPGSANAELPEARGLRWVALWTLFLGISVSLLMLLLITLVVAGLLDDIPVEVVEAPLLIAIVLLGIGLFVTATGYGIARRKRWAWKSALVIQGLGVLQFVLALASGGLQGVVALGIVPTLIGLLIFYYLTRPHVAAAFKAGGG